MESEAGFPAARWAAVLGGLRDVVRQEVLRGQLAAIVAERERPWRVLDVGAGQGTQALHLARAGHLVTCLDPSEEMLGRLRTALTREPVTTGERVRLVAGPGEEAASLTEGSFDLVLCHGVLMYLADPTELLAALAQVTGTDGMISLLVRNGLALAMRPGMSGRWADALAAFDGRDYVNRLGVRAVAHTPAQLDVLLAGHGFERVRWFGVRVFTDHLDGPAAAAAELDQLIAAEGEAGRREPYRRVAALLHLVYQRPDA